MGRIILTNKATGATTYMEAEHVDGFFLAGAARADYDMEDETVELIQPFPELPHLEQDFVVSDVSPELSEEQRVVIYGEPETPTVSEVTNG